MIRRTDRHGAEGDESDEGDEGIPWGHRVSLMSLMIHKAYMSEYK